MKGKGGRAAGVTMLSPGYTTVRENGGCQKRNRLTTSLAEENAWATGIGTGRGSRDIVSLTNCKRVARREVRKRML